MSLLQRNLSEAIEHARSPHISGWDPEMEAAQAPVLDQLAKSAQQWFGDHFTYSTPAKVDPRNWLRIENQGQIGACQGFALTTCQEFAYWVAKKGGVIQFSPWFAYR